MESKKSLPMRLLFLLCLVGLSVSESHCSGNLTVHPGTIKVLKGSKGLFNVTLCHNNTGSVVIHFQSSAEAVLTVEDNITIPQGEVGQPYPVEFHAKDAGITNIQMSSTQVDVSSEFVLVSSMENEALDTIAVIIGWIYFVAWSVSFYPQVYLNFRRKSVVGLSFDFLSYNFTGFLAYGIFNVGLYWIDEIKEEYTKQHKYSVIPVQLNDVVFTIHAFFITCVTIFKLLFTRGAFSMASITNSGRYRTGVVFAIIGRKDHNGTYDKSPVHLPCVCFLFTERRSESHNGLLDSSKYRLDVCNCNTDHNSRLESKCANVARICDVHRTSNLVSPS
ncbi:putative cystinosin [Apostichopus japonicus]|uniref:Putative cystinosin n=1 Tax=Stichopus japonicus TaxID=307972 RepID=A0A2G8KJ41_STIJA|nr:putative cystinosin [Apostichopus japonicus]